jgi:hypothetical protein
MGAADRLRARFGKTEVLHLTFLNQVLDGARNVFDRNIEVDSMLLKQVYGIDLQPLKRPFCHLFDVFWPTVERAPLASIAGVGFPSELRRDYDFPAKRGERFAYQFFVDERAVYLGGIEERDTSLDGGVQQRNHLLLVFRRPIGPTHSHAAEPESRHLQIALSKFAFLHCF